MKNRSISFLVFGVLGIIGASPAFGNTLFASCSASTQMTVTQLAPTATGSVACQQFNPALGTLTSAAFASPVLITFQAGSSFTVFNPSNLTVTVPNSVFGANLAFTFGPFLDGLSSQGGGPLVSASQGPLSFAPGESPVLTAASVEPYIGFSFSGTLLSTTGFTDFVGTGTFNVPVSLTAGFVGVAQLTPLVMDTYNATVSTNAGNEVLYTYTPTPEPSNLALAITGLALGLVVWFRKAIKQRA